MGGDPVVSGLSKMLEIAISAALEEYKLARGAREEIKKLKNAFQLIHAVLRDAELKELRSEGVRSWLRNLKDISFEIDDLLDEFAFENLRLKVEGDRPGSENKVWDSLLCCIGFIQSLLHDNKVAHEIKEIRERLDEIAKQRRDLGLVELDNLVEAGEASWHVQNQNRRETSHLVDIDKVFGRNEAREDIVRLVTGREQSEVEVSVVPIVGIGGIGKTTLAQLVFNDERVDDHFLGMKWWLYVGFNFDAKKVMEEIIMSKKKERPTNPNLGELQEDVIKILKDQRFLIVLDDVWSQDQSEWEKLWLPFTRGGKGSKVLITTRNESVGRVMNARDPTVLEVLPDEDCWLIFKKIAFVNVTSDKYPKLEKIGMEIVHKIKGLPLAAKTVGGLLSHKLDENEWQRILESEIWELPQNDGDVLPALRLSYQHMLPHLKQCFAYCSIFRKGHRFEKEKLVKIWMAQGFIHSQGRETMETIGSNYFENLLWVSFFQIVEGHYVMHDLVHDLARSVSLEECIALEGDCWPEMPQKVRHLSWFYGHESEPEEEIFSLPDPLKLENLYKCNHLRTFLFKQTWRPNSNPIPLELFLRLKFLRVLELRSPRIDDVPSSIGELKHLRYLYISSNRITELPETLCHLYNLQTLIIEECWDLKELPQGLTNLINMRHLEAVIDLVSAITGIGKLQELQNLATFKVLKENGHKIGELEDMNALRGDLCILNLENVESREEAATSKLTDKEHLHKLILRWNDNRIDDLQGDGKLDEEVLEGLQPNLKLSKLSIEGYGGVGSPTWIMNGLLSNIESIQLRDCKRWEVLPPLENLPFLNSLELKLMRGTKRLGHSASPMVFPRLEKLEIHDMPEWNEWFGIDDGQRWFPCLCKLVICNCPKLKRLPSLPSTLEEIILRNVGLDALPELQGFEDGMLTQISSSGSSCLSTIEISTCPNLKSLDTKLLQCDLRALESLVIRNCQGLRSLPERWSKEGGFNFMKNLRVELCPKLMSSSLKNRLPLLPPSSLVHLQLGDLIGLDDMLSQCLLKNLSTSLTHLSISGCPRITSLSRRALGHLTALKVMVIRCCSGMVELEFEGLVSLFSLEISGCPSLTSLPWEALRHLTALNRLELRHCEGLTLLGLQALVSLKELTIENCLKLNTTEVPFLSPPSLPLERIHLNKTNNIFLPHQPVLRNLCSLLELWIENCPEITSLCAEEDPPISLSSLRVLHIDKCVNFLSLPDLQTLSSLEVLRISNCPNIQGFRESGFPASLRALTVWGCPHLERWRESLTRIASER